MYTLLVLLSCNTPAYEDVSTKLVGVGYDPDEIGPAPTPYGGVVEYSWVNFAGGGLSLALMGLGSFDEISPSMGGYRPPFAAVYGFSYVFSQKLAAADALGGITSVPPAVPDTCYTSFDASGPIGSFRTVDVGSWMEFTTTDEAGLATDGGLRMGRNPPDYPANPQDVFVYYIGFEYYAATATRGLVPTLDTTEDPGTLGDTVVSRRNFPFGESVEFRFPGAIGQTEIPVASLPRPSTGVGENTRYTLPTRPEGVQMEWTGPRRDSYGNEVPQEAGVVKTCLAYAAPSTFAPENADACIGADVPDTQDYAGQIYTGPWETDDGKVTFRWQPGAMDGEIVSIAVRFLGAVDRRDPNYLEHVVTVKGDEISETALDAWKDSRRGAGGIPDDMECPEGRRAPANCHEVDEAAWVFDDAYLDANGNLAPALRGDPFHNVAEVTCRLEDDGEYTLRSEQLEEALTYAKRSGAEGAIFYFARSTEVDAEVPPAKDQYNQKLDISPVKLTSRAVDIGRFWYEE